MKLVTRVGITLNIQMHPSKPDVIKAWLTAQAWELKPVEWSTGIYARGPLEKEVERAGREVIQILDTMDLYDAGKELQHYAHAEERGAQP